MFRGINAVNLDIKGRIAIPVKYRERLSQEAKDQVVLTIDTEEKALLLYPLPVWEEIEEKVAALPSFYPASRRIQRLLIGHAAELTLDSHGRILLPQLLRDYADVHKRVILLGQGKKFEIWDEKVWQSAQKKWMTSRLKGGDQLPDELKNVIL